MLLLSSLIVFVIIATLIVDDIELSSANDFSEFKKALAEWEPETEDAVNYRSLFSFNPNTISEEKIDSLLLPTFVKRNILSYRNAGGEFDEPGDLRKIYGMNDSVFAAVENYISIPQPEPEVNFKKKEQPNLEPESKSFTGSFDPNSADENTLRKFGFNGYQASNLIKYRKSGGSFSTSRDVLKIYGIGSAFYKQIEKHIQIESFEKSPREDEPEIVAEPEIHIELNSADSTELVKLRGVGSVFANRIIKYRNLLGGFYTTDQLLEVYNFPEETYRQIEPHIFVNQQKIQRIRLNFADYGQLIRHPYIEKDHVKAILDYRNSNGAFQSVEQLVESGIIDPEKVSKIKPYISCR